MAYHSTAALAKNFFKLAQQCRTGVTRKLLSPVKHRSIIEGGFPYEDFNARAMLQPWGIMKLFEWGRMTAWFDKDEPFLDFDKMDTLIYMASASLQIDPRVYNVNLEKRPIVIDAELDYLGKTSLKLKLDMYFPGQTESLIQGAMQVVLVDVATKKPGPPPHWWMDKFRAEVNKSGKPLILANIPIPDNAQVMEEEFVVLPSDTDPYVHASSAQYIKFVVESYISWHIKKYGYVESGDPFRNLKSMCQSFRGEAGIGDVIKVRFWPSADNKDLFHFHLLKGTNLIHECVAEFYPLQY